jgi:hypothetical protein
LEQEVASASSEMVPAAQFLQESAWPVSSAYLPAWQMEHDAAAAALYRPTAHETQVVDPAEPANDPAAQLEQDEAAAAENLPVWHAVPARKNKVRCVKGGGGGRALARARPYVQTVPPREPLYLPAEQSSHDDWPTPDIFPIAHWVHAEPSEFSAVPSLPVNLPAAQLLQSLMPTPEYLPTAHREQELSPEVLACLPAAQSVQEVAPVEETVPDEQGEQADEPEIEAYVPGAQSVHDAEADPL